MADGIYVTAGLAGGPDDRLSRLLLHIFLMVFASTCMRDRLSLARTSRKLRAICTWKLQATVTQVLQKFNLSYTKIRFMQTAMMTVISGPIIAYLMDRNFTPPFLDFYTLIKSFSAVM
jgi:hypothetical protein